MKVLFKRFSRTCLKLLRPRIAHFKDRFRAQNTRLLNAHGKVNQVKDFGSDVWMVSILLYRSADYLKIDHGRYINNRVLRH